jgi:hypothetical protein
MNKTIELILLVTYIVIISILFIALLTKYLPLIVFGAIALPIIHIICNIEW